MRTALAIAMLTHAALARAEAPVPLVRADDAEPISIVADEPQRTSPLVGLELGAGVPSGIEAQLAFMPWGYAARLQAGAAFDGIAAGIEGGLVIAPLHTIVAPVLALEVGHFFEGDARHVFGIATPDKLGPMLSRVGYDFASAELGVEIGAPDSFVFTLRAGLAGVQSTLHGISESLGVANVTAEDLSLRAIVPDARLGLVVFF